MHPIRRPLLLAVAALGGFLLVYALSNLTAAGQAWENHLLRAHDAFGMLPEYIDSDSPVPPFVLDVQTVVAGTVLAVGIAAARRRWRQLVLIAVATLVAVVATALFKHVAGRPDLIGATLDTDVSYPSGHAAIAFAVSAALLVVVPARHLRWCVPLLLGWSLLVAAVLQSVGDHRPSEVLGSALLVAAVFLLVGAGPTAPLRGPRPRGVVGVVPAIVLVAVVIAGSWNTVPWAIALYAVVAAVSVGLVGWTALGVRGHVPATVRPTRPSSGTQEAPADTLRV